MTLNERGLFDPVTFPNGMRLRNRIVMAPMTTWSGNPDGTVSNAELAYMHRRVNGVGLVVTGCTHVLANGVGFTDEFASFDDRFVPGLKRLATAAKSGGATAVLQLFHAGNKAVSELVPDGDVVSASAVASEAGPFNLSLTPRAMTTDEIRDAIRAFGDATRRAIDAGFDGVELHGAHGFLLQNFFSPLYNRRSDGWGGSLEDRMRFPLAVVAEVRRVVAAHANRPFLLGYRISPEESAAGGFRIADTRQLIDKLVEGGIDYLHASLTDVLSSTPVDQSDEATMVELLSAEVGGRVPLVAAGQVRTPCQARRALDLGLSLVAIGQGLLMNPDWVELAQGGRDCEIDVVLHRSKVPDIAIPTKLWTVIEATTGWFQLQGDVRQPS